MTAPLLEALCQAARRPHHPFYAPGHKRGVSIPPDSLLPRAMFELDLPELPELDNLFAPSAALQAAQELASVAFGADQTWFLVNGSTGGVLAAILATCRPGGTLILPRNLHQSVIAAVVLAGVNPVFINPHWQDSLWGGIAPSTLEAALQEHPQAQAVLVTSPTYQGVCSDISALATLAHARGIPLVVDEAHGPHFAFHPQLPPSALGAGADLVVQSTHKVLSALTQAAMLHRRGERVEGRRVSQALQLVQSSSPSFLLLASLDGARQQVTAAGETLLDQTLALAAAARAHIRQTPGLGVLTPTPHQPGFFAQDLTRLVVDLSQVGLGGFAADRICYTELGIIPECPTWQHLTFILSLGNTWEDVEALGQALAVLGRDYRGRDPVWPLPAPPLAPRVVPPREAFFAPSRVVPLEQALDRVCGELLCPYPPGVPVLMPGEVVTAGSLAYLEQVQTRGAQVVGTGAAQLVDLRVLET